MAQNVGSSAMTHDFGQWQRKQFSVGIENVGLNLMRRQCGKDGLTTLRRRRQNTGQDAGNFVVEFHEGVGRPTQ
ncbi:hypothetical protein D3C86_1774780 [compost metagenome]